MKKIFTTILIFGSIIQAQAADIVVYYGNARSYSFLYGSFDTNKELGRAWVTLAFSSSGPDSTTDELRILIPGMKYDQTTKEVVIDAEDGRIVCAYEKRDIFGVRSLRKTNNCKFIESFKIIEFDNGFEIQKRKKRTITLVY